MTSLDRRLAWYVARGLFVAVVMLPSPCALSAKAPLSATQDTPTSVVAAPPTATAPPATTSPAVPALPLGGPSALQTGLPQPPPNWPSPPSSQDKTIEPDELVVVSSNMADARALAQQAQVFGIDVKRRTNLKGLGFVVSVLRVPKQTAVGDALAALRKSVPSAWIDANHRYTLQGDDALHYGQRLIGLGQPSPHCGGGVRIGMVDSALDTRHPVLSGRAIRARSFVTTGVRTAALDHGTATAALLVGNSQPSGFHGLVPGATLMVASVFRSNGDHNDTTAEWVTLALDWLILQNVQVINLSLGGPRNQLLEAAITRVLARGVTVVAAAGNNGPAAAPVYPAAQQGVIAVTAVDAALEPYRRANHGDYISFAAPGVDVWTAAPGKAGVFVSGTSYAVPFVTAAVVTTRIHNRSAHTDTLVKSLQNHARDLGDRGKDPVFGWGLVQAPACVTAGAKGR